MMNNYPNMSYCMCENTLLAMEQVLTAMQDDPDFSVICRALSVMHIRNCITVLVRLLVCLINLPKNLLLGGTFLTFLRLQTLKVDFY